MRLDESTRLEVEESVELGDSTRRDTMTINMGPQHPSTHGVLRLILTLDGETIIGCVPILAISTPVSRRPPKNDLFPGPRPY